MKVYIFCDLEGISGLPSSQFVLDDSPKKADGAKMMAADINACVDACFQAGATEVVVRDGHGAGYNVTRMMIDKRAWLVQGATGRVRFAGLEGACAMILLGYHAMAGTPDAVLEHTYSSKSIQNMYLNGRKVGEIGIDAAIAAEHNVPVVMVSGDDKTCAEAEDCLPGVVTCQVKIGLGTQSALLMPTEQAYALIAAKTREALGKLSSIPKIKVTYPATLRTEGVERSGVSNVMDAIHVDGRTWERTGDSVEKLLLW